VDDEDVKLGTGTEEARGERHNKRERGASKEHDGGGNNDLPYTLVNDHIDFYEYRRGGRGAEAGRPE
jgi:hypothetical protein